MSGHRCKASLNTYNINMTVDQKRKPSYVLATTINNPDHNNTNKSNTSNNISSPLVSVHVLPEIL